jgi:hypothetical protein
VAPSGANNQQDKSTSDVIADLWQLVRDYAKQETIDPLKSIGRYLKLGLGGAVLLTLGLVFGVLAILRVLQQETGAHLTGSWNFVPYLVATVFCILVIGLCVRSVTKPNRAGERP